MASTLSSMVSLGSPASDFELPDMLSGKKIKLSELVSQKKPKAVVIMFICNHCPFVISIKNQLVTLTNEYLQKNIIFIAINSNDIENYPDDSPEKMKELAENSGFKFPYCFDESQEVAKAYKATCTPDFFVYNSELKLAYRGQLDNSRPSNNLPATGEDLRKALDCLMANKPVFSEQKPSIGCNIKWKATAN